MEWRIKNCNIFEIYRKIQVLGFKGGGGGGVHEKSIYKAVWLKWEAWTICRFKGEALLERGGDVFEGGGADTPMNTMILCLIS